MTTESPTYQDEVDASSSSSMGEDESRQATGSYYVLSEILDTFKEPDIYNFLFTSESIQLPYFGSATFGKRALTAALSSTRTELTSCTDCVSDHIEGSVVYIPALSLRNKTLGFGFHCCENIRSKEGAMYAERKAMRREARFVHDDQAGTFTTILHAPEADELVLCYKRRLSAGCQTHVCVWLQRRRLLTLLKHDSLTLQSLTPQSLSPLVTKLQTGLEMRVRPGGVESPGSPTSAASEADSKDRIYEEENGSEVRRAKHPFDADSFRLRVNDVVGTFHGSGQVVEYANGEATRQYAVRLMRSIQMCDNAALTERLRLGAMHRAAEEQIGWALGAAAARIRRAREKEREKQEEKQEEEAKEREGMPRASRGNGMVSELKAAMRKERNRASARRSNMKKKAVNDGLKQALLNGRRTVEGLRTVELELRRENLELRRMVARRKATAPALVARPGDPHLLAVLSSR